MKEMLIKLSREVRGDISRKFGGGVIFNRGAFSFASEPLRFITVTAGLISQIGSAPELINLPNTTEREKELLSLGQLLVQSLHEKKGRLKFLAPVCPDYSQESSDAFYQTIGEGISPQAYAAIRASKFIEETFSQHGFDPKIQILVADTEDDIPEVMARCVNGDPEVYQSRCMASVRAIREELSSKKDVDVTTFTQGLGNQFRQTQYDYEDVIRRLRKTNLKFDQEVQKLGEMRRDRHSKILGRKEINFELTIRYMAQYASLGTLARKYEEPTILLNYPTPNLPFYNAATFRDSRFSLSEDDLRVVPVMETIL